MTSLQQFDWLKLHYLPVEVLCQILKYLTWDELNLVEQHIPGLSRKIITCISEIDFLNGAPLFLTDYNLNKIPARSSDLVSNAIARFPHLQKYYAKIEADSIEEAIVFLEDNRAQELSIIAIGGAIPVANLIKGLNDRLVKYGKNFILDITTSNSRSYQNEHFAYIKGTVLYNFRSIDDLGIGDLFKEFPNSVDRLIDINLDEEVLEEFDVYRVISRNKISSWLPENTQEYEYVGYQIRPYALDMNDLNRYSIPIQILKYKVPIELESYHNNGTGATLIELFRGIFPNVRRLYPVEYFELKYRPDLPEDLKNKYMAKLISYYEAYGEIIALPRDD